MHNLRRKIKVCVYILKGRPVIYGGDMYLTKGTLIDRDGITIKYKGDRVFFYKAQNIYFAADSMCLSGTPSPRDEEG